LHPLRLFHTVCHLRPVQIYGRVWHRLYRPRLDRRPAPPLRRLTGKWEQPCERRPSLIDAETFRFLNVSAAVRNPGDWDDSSRARLWRYNANYFDDLNAAGAPVRKSWHHALVDRWVAENPGPDGAGWEPYPTSLRITNWIKWMLSASARGDLGLNQAALNSLATQTRWLSQRLEIHLLGNHLLANAKALIFAGTFFEGNEPDRWLSVGIKLLKRELDEQILSDGGHFERSPMYHALILEDVFDLINLARAAPATRLSILKDCLLSVAVKMHRWLRVMTHPDGRIALFNDAAFGIAPEEAALSDYARCLSIPVRTEELEPVETLPASGYVRLQNSRAVMICDVGLIGPDYLPGHAHADTLSFELSLDGRRVIVDSGTSTYDAGPKRQRQRSTAAHNTVEVDGLDSSEVWGCFRVARRARPLDVRWGSDGDKLWAEGSHDGYTRVKRGVTHHRRWVLESCALSIHDRLAGTFHSAVSALHLHPEISVDAVRPASARVAETLANPTISVDVSPPGLSAQRSEWFPEFGLSEENWALRTFFSGPTLKTRVKWC
jgi:uncharacterized heparinase superfamily protein